MILLLFTIMSSLVTPNQNTGGAGIMKGLHLFQKNAQASVCGQQLMAGLHAKNALIFVL
jgi:hypothetical protein